MRTSYRSLGLAVEEPAVAMEECKFLTGSKSDANRTGGAWAKSAEESVEPKVAHGTDMPAL